MVEKKTITAQKSLLRLPDGTYIIPFTNTSSALEIGDIGQALFVDETKGTRRILNGQIVDINENTKQFLDYLLAVKTQYPQLFVTEEEWHAERATSELNQIGKFVLNPEVITQYEYHAIKYGDVIENQGVVSGFSSSNYLKFPNLFKPENQNWEIVFKIKTTKDIISGQQILFAFGKGNTSETRYATRVYINNSTKLGISVTYDGTSWDINTDSGTEGSVGLTELSLDTVYYIKFTYDGNSYKLDYSTDNINYINECNVISSTPMCNDCTECTIGAWISTTPTNPFLGEIDFNESYIKIGGEIWWKGLTIHKTNPYIRIPAVINAQGLYNLQNIGAIIESGLPDHTHSGTTSSNGAHTHTRGTMNIKGTFAGNTDDGATHFSGPFYIHSTASSGANGGSGQGVIGFDASKNWSGATSSNGAHTHTMTTGGASDTHYGKSNTVQEEAIQYPYFIQIAHEHYTPQLVRNNLSTINPYTLFDYKYSYNPLNNASWLVSVKQQNPRQTYTSAYEALCVELNDAIQTNETVNLPSGGRYTKHLQSLYYDQSKLTLVGLPSISLNGLLSNANESNYAKLNVNTAISNATSYTLKLRFQFIADSTIVSTSTAVTPNALLIRTVGDKIQTQISLSNTEWDYTIDTANTFIECNWYDLKLTFNNTNGYTFEISDDLGATYTTEWFLREESTRLTPESNFLLFGASYNILGVPIDLKTIQFTYDGTTINCNRQENLVWDSREHAPTEANYDKKFIVDRVNETFRLPLKVDRELNNGEELYFYIGDVAQNSALIDIGRITEQLARLQAEVDKLKG
jgi:hypothetical protein